MWLFFGEEDEILRASSVDIDFKTTLPTGFALSRPEAALGRSPANGRWISHDINVPRFDIDPISLVSRGLMVDPARTQIFFKSRTPSYTPTQSTNVADANIQTPFGSGCLKLTPNTTLAQHGFDLGMAGTRTAPVPNNTTVAIRVVMKGVGYTRFTFFLRGRDLVYKTCSVDLSGAGSVVSHTLAAARVTQDTDGFYSVEMVWPVMTGTTDPILSMNFLQGTGAGVRTHAGDGTSHALIAYLGGEIGTECTTPILSDGVVPVSRVDETLSGNVSWINPSANSFALQYIPRTAGEMTILNVNGSAGNSIELTQGQTGVLSHVVYASGAGVAATTAQGPSVNAPHTALVVTGSDDFRSYMDGTRIGIDSQGAIPLDLSFLYFGAMAAGSVRGPITVSRLKYWPFALGDFSAKAFSTDITIEGELPDVARIDIQATRMVLPTENAVTLTLVLDGNLLGSSFSYRTVDGTAVGGVDYVPQSGSVFVDQSAVSATITILLGERSLVEDRSFRVELYGETNAILLNRYCTITLERVIQAGSPATTQYDFDTNPATVPADWVHSRASVGYARNSSGIWTFVAANVPRFHFYAPGVSGLLLEGAGSEQRLFDSVDPQITVSNATRNVVTTEQTQTGMRQLQWRKNAVVVDHKMAATFSTANCDMPTADFTLWFIGRWINWIYWKLRVKGIDNVWREVVFNFSGNGSIVSADSGATGYILKDPWFTGWYRFGMYRTQAATAGVSAEFELIPCSDTGVNEASGDVSHGIDICHVQLEPAPGMSTPLIVQGATAKTVRSPDVFKVNTALTWFKDNDYSIGLKFMRLRDQPSGQRIIQMRDTSVSATNDDIGLQTINGGLNFPIKVAGATLTAGGSSKMTVAGVPTTAVIVQSAANSLALFHEGTKEYQIALTTPPSPVGIIRLAATEPSGLNPASILVQSIYHWSYPLTDADAALFSGNINYVPPGAPPKPVVSVPTTLTVAEGGIISIPVTKVGNAACQVSFTTKAQTAKFGTDYNGVGPVTVTFTAGETTKTVAVQTLSDAVADPSESFAYTISLIDTSCVLGNASGTCTLLEPAVVTIPASAYGTEGQTLNITLTKTGNGACSVNYRTQAGTAALNVDYTGFGPLTATFADTETTKVIPISILADAISDPGEKFNFLIETPVGCTLGNPKCEITILQAGETPPPAGSLYTTPVTFANTSDTGVANDFGVGGDVYYVTSLGDNATTPATGTLRHALSQSNRVIVFEVGGVIKVPQAGIRCTGKNLTIAGETAPSPGIIIQGGEFIASGAQNINMRHITFERGYDTRQESFVPGNGNSNGDAFQLIGDTINNNPVVSQNIWIDHCATLWSNDEGIQFWKNNGKGTIENISITNTIIAEPLYMPETLINPDTKKNYLGHWEGGSPETPHNYGFLIGYGVKRVDIQHCAFIDSYWRGPMIDGGTSVVLANNAYLNCRIAAHFSCNTNGTKQNGGGLINGPTYVTLDGALCISGPNTGATNATRTGGHSGFKFHGDSENNTATYLSYPKDSKIWVKNLYALKGAKTAYPLPLTEVVGRKDTTTLSATEQGFMQDNSKTSTRPIDVYTAVAALSQDDLLARVKLNVGPRPKERAQPHIARQAKKFTDLDSKWVNHESEVGGLSGSATTKLDGTSRSLRGQNLATPPKFKDGTTTIPAFPSPATDKTAVRAWLRKFLDELQYD